MARIDNETRQKLHVVAHAVRIGYPRVFEVEENAQSGKREYSLQIRWMDDNPDHMKQVEAMQARLKLAAKAYWGEEWEKHYRDAIDSKNTRFLRHNEDEGYWFCSIKRGERDGAPRVVDRCKEVKLRPEDGKIYSGMVGNVVFDLWCYGGVARNGAKVPYGFSGTLLGLQYVADGEPFGGARMAKDNDFEDLEDNGLSDDLDNLL